MCIPGTLREGGFRTITRAVKHCSVQDCMFLCHGTFTRFSMSDFDCLLSFPQLKDFAQTVEGALPMCLVWLMLQRLRLWGY